MRWDGRYFRREDGSRYVPLGLFSCYFPLSYVGEELAADSQHGGDLMEFQHATVGTWRKLFRFLSEEDGINAVRMFPRGDSGGSAWEGLDVGGRVNLSLFEKIRAFMREAKSCGVGLQLCLFTEPECSFYCQKYTRTYWGTRFWSEEEIAAASPAQRRFLENPADLVSYDAFFTDPDVRTCCHLFLDELLPLLREIDGLYAVELFNESGWASPHAVPPNTFRWEDTPGYLDWHRDMTEHVKRMLPEIPVTVSNPGVGLLGHDPIHWCREIRPDFFSLHTYPNIMGAPLRIDYAAATDAVLAYTAALLPVMTGEWEALEIRRASDPRYRELLPLLSRDMAWFTLLSGAPGCVSWMARGFGQYHAVKKIFSRLDGKPLTPSPALLIDVRKAEEYFESLWKKGSASCLYPDELWCPDRDATDGEHRFCVKAESREWDMLLRVEEWSLAAGVPFAFTLSGENGAIPLEKATRRDFEAAAPFLLPSPGYRQKVLSADGGSVRLIYLQNAELRTVREDLREDGRALYSLRGRRAVDLTLRFTDPAFRVTLFDLDTGDERECDPSRPLPLGVTDRDYLILAEKK
ncbi:MAG: hypothetical protein J5849_03075 [Clostridia bacterium]|nr:hypothetical protein [Clostridia bacterium]